MLQHNQQTMYVLHTFSKIAYIEQVELCIFFLRNLAKCNIKILLLHLTLIGAAFPPRRCLKSEIYECAMLSSKNSQKIPGRFRQKEDSSHQEDCRNSPTRWEECEDCNTSNEDVSFAHFGGKRVQIRLYRIPGLFMHFFRDFIQRLQSTDGLDPYHFLICGSDKNLL